MTGTQRRLGEGCLEGWEKGVVFVWLGPELHGGGMAEGGITMETFKIGRAHV